MTDDTYTTLNETARRRISEEWSCSAAEGQLLLLICDLSFALGQSWCVVPCLADFAAACGIHKSTASRALRAAVQKGYLQSLSRQGETLYSLIVTTRGQQREQDRGREEAKERLLKLNRTRLQGRADADGQERLPGVFDSEEIDAPAAAFAAMVEQPREIVSAVPADPLQKLMATMREREREQEPQPPERPPPRAETQRMVVGSFDSQWSEMTRGLNDQAIHCLEQIRSEFQQRKGAEAEFFQWRFLWRKRAMRQTRLYLEAAAVCKAMRLESGTVCDSPGAFIYRSVEEAVKTTS